MAFNIASERFPRRTSSIHIDTRPDWRGGQSQVLLTIKGLRARGHRVELMALAGGALEKRAAEEGFVVHAIPRSLVRARGAQKLRGLIRGHKFQIVHAHDPHALTLACLAHAQRHAVLLAHRRVANPLNRNAIALGRYRAARRVVAISKFVAQSVLQSGIRRKQIEIVYEGVEIPPQTAAEARTLSRRNSKLPLDGPLLGCVGYLLPEKGQEVLIRALPAIVQRYPKCRLVLAGDGPRRASLEALARELSVADRVIFLGFTEDVAEVYRAIDVFLFPSHAEPLGTSLLAAMGYGLPVIAVAAGGVTEIVQGGRDGMLLQSSDARTFAKAIMSLLENPQHTSDLGEAARQTAQKRFSADVMVENTIEMYLRLIEEPR